MKKEKKSISRKMAEIVSNLENEDGTILFDLDFMKKTLEENTGFDEDGNQKYIDKFAWIIHDKDTKIVKNDETGEEVEISVIPHVHLQLHFPYAVSFNRIARDFKIEENFVSTIKSKKFARALLYLVHGNLSAQDKYQYNWDEVISNFDVEQEVTKLTNKVLLKDILEQILKGEIKNYNKYEKIPSEILLYYNSKVETAFKLRAEKMIASSHNRSINVILIYGASGVGKTTLAKRIAESSNLSYYISSEGKNWADDFSDQECVIMEDFDENAINFKSMLRILDNNCNAGISARYRNRFIESELFIITTTRSIDELYSNPFNEITPQDMIQLKRRITTTIHVMEDIIIVYQWDKVNKRYKQVSSFVNDTLAYIEEKTVAEEKKNAIDYLSFLNETTIKQTIKQSKHTGKTYKPSVLTDEIFTNLIEVKKKEGSI
ncbi:Rep family protein [Amedibacillus sp. YH-ame10]